MPTIVKVQKKGQVTLPTRLRYQAGIKDGDLVEATFQRGKIILTPKPVLDLSGFPNADDEYTPAQRRIIDARLDKADEDIKAGRVHGPFANHEDMVEFLHREVKKAKAHNATKRTGR